MFSYGILEWILFFYIYCIFGWIFESTYVSLKSRKFVNRGFLKGPMIPIYGEGAIMMLIATTPVRGNIVLEFIMGLAGATLLEWAVGASMESLFKVKYWDYSNQRFQYKGYICLSSSLCWGALSVFMAEVIHNPIETVVTKMSQIPLAILVSVISVVFMIDAYTSAKEAWNLRILLVALTKAKEEIAILQLQLEVKKEELMDQIEIKKEEFVEDLYARKDSILQSLKGNLSVLDVDTLKNKIEDELGKYHSLVEKLSSSTGWILTRNPGATSHKFHEALENVKEYIESKRKINKK